MVDARKERVGEDELAPWFRGKKRLVVSRGKKFTEYSLRALKPAQRAELVLGPSGNLRAPTLHVGDAVLVGFHEEVYEREIR